MLLKTVKCPRCFKSGFITLRWVRSSHYGLIEMPYNKPKKVIKEENNKLVDRYRVTYGPFWHLYVGHFDEERYRKATDEFKKGLRKSRPNGRRWCKMRKNPGKGEAQSDIEKLMSDYSFTQQDISDEIREKRREYRWKREFTRD